MNSNPYKDSGNRFDLEDRLLRFAKDVRSFLKGVPRTRSNIEDAVQVIRSSGSIGANYIEANEHLGKKDLLMRIKISKKEAKETRYWLQIIDSGDSQDLMKIQDALLQEADEITRILGSILKALNK